VPQNTESYNCKLNRAIKAQSVVKAPLLIGCPLLIGYFTVRLIVRNWISMLQILLRAVLFAPLIIPVTLERSETHGAFIIFFGAEYK